MSTNDNNFVAIVDDDQMVLRALTRLLLGSGYRVECHASGAEVLRSLADATPGCIVLDINMPGLDGFDVQRALARTGQRIPVIMITGAYSADIQARATAHGAVACLPKPVDGEQLIDVLSQALQTSGSSNAQDVVRTLSPAATRTVLCVLPNEDLHPSVTLALSKYQVVITTSAREALREHSAKPFDAYVFDPWLPDWNGPSLCREIRLTDPHVPICVYARTHSDGLKRRVLHAGANVFLHVDEGAAVLASRIRALLYVNDTDNLKARVEEDRAIQDELSRRASWRFRRPGLQCSALLLRRSARRNYALAPSSSRPAARSRHSTAGGRSFTPAPRLKRASRVRQPASSRSPQT